MEGLLILIAAIGFIPICGSILGLGFALFAMVYWIQTLVRLMQVERGEDKIAWLLLVLFLHFIGALIYNAVRGNTPAPRRVQAPNWLGSRPPVAHVGRDSLATTLIIVGSVFLILTICFTVSALSVVNNQPLPTRVVPTFFAPAFDGIATPTAWTLLTPEPVDYQATINAIETETALIINPQTTPASGFEKWLTEMMQSQPAEYQTQSANRDATETAHALTPQPTATPYIINVCFCTDTPTP